MRLSCFSRIAIKSIPGRALHSQPTFDNRPTVKTTVRWAGDGDFVGRDSQGKGLLFSVGDGPGHSPMQTLLMAMASCAMYDVGVILAKQRTPLESLNVDVEGQRGTEGARPWKTIHMHFRLAGNVPLDKAEKAVQMSTERYCGVHATLEGVAKITYSVEVAPSSDKVSRS
eukprot:TRINITY_DN2711_c0_g1_i1.p1 TRINITY_DN2711_c0_g1~~TRINITY_DN2711_c0_g1_i1.p1  ORF type:complete len:170 (+),score=19.96 TRINITY_DN2711_c0_g1_i1:111-620(+)